MRIGVVFTNEDTTHLMGRNLDAVLIATACPMDTRFVEVSVGVPVLDLNDFIVKGEMAPLSRDCAAFIRNALQGIDLPSEAKASQGDIYQYHLRKQHLFMTALARFLVGQDTPVTLVFPFKELSRYVSPMRPELDVLFNDFRSFGYLANSVAADAGSQCEFLDHRTHMLTRVQDRVVQTVRALLLQAYILWKLFRKTQKATVYVKRNAESLNALAASNTPKVGIIVRTDSEVVSAAAIIDKLQANGVGYLVIQDELLASETTSQRLDNMNIQYFPIGGARGKRGLLKAFPLSALGCKGRVTSQIASNLQGTRVMLGLERLPMARWMAARLFDFRMPQLHFKSELAALIASYDLKQLITFAYVDQWGPVVQATGADAGIKTICVQNAAQDPEEFPRLAWSDHYCVESLYLKDELRGFGYPPEKISATGLPHFTSGSKSQNELVETSGRPAILLVTQPIYYSYYVQLIRRLSQFCANNGCELHIKYHPRQLGDEYATTISEVSDICPIRIFHRESLDAALDHSKLSISVVSAAIVRSINYGVPALSFLPKSEKYLDIYYCAPENLFVADTFDALEQTLQGAMDNFPAFWKDFKSRRQHYIENHLNIEPTYDASVNIFKVIDAYLPSEVRSTQGR